MKEYIIYEGGSFTVEWYIEVSGNSQPFDYFEALDRSQQIKFLTLAKRLGDKGKIFNKEKFNNEGDKIFAFKPQPDRFLCFFQKGKKVALLRFCEVKKMQRLS